MKSMKTWTNRKALTLLSAAALSLSSSMALAADQAFEKHLAREYPGAKTQVLTTRQINGVTVHDVHVQSTGWESDATITESGDYLLAKLPEKAGNIPPDVQKVTQGFFGGAPSSVEAFVVTNYIVGVNSNGKGYDVKFDATGRITDIDTKQQVASEDPHKQPKASAEVAAKVSKLVEQRFPGSKISSVNRSDAAADFYTVSFNDEGQQSWVIISEDNRVRSYAQKIPNNQLPKSVAKEIGQIKGAKADAVWKYTYHYWQLEQAADGDTITMKVRPDGDVISVESREARQTQDAATASHKQKAGANPAKKAS